MQVSNQPHPHVAPADGEPPRQVRTYAEVVAGVGLHPKGVGKAWFEEGKGIDWGPALAVTQTGGDKAELNAEPAKILLGSYADSLVAPKFLAVVGGSVKVIYGLRTCRPLDPEGRRFACLMGDRSVSEGGTSLPPKLFITHPEEEQRRYQYRAIQAARVRAPSTQAIQDLLAGDAELELVDLVEGGEEITVSRMLPVHEKLAALFVKGMTPKEAFQLGLELLDDIPASHLSACDHLLYFLRAAITQSAEGVSTLQVEWHRQDPCSSPQLEEWYLSLCENYAPTWHVPPPAPGRPPEPAPSPLPPPGVDPEGPTTSKQPHRRPYTTDDLLFLHRIFGIEPMMDADLTADTLPPFWRGFEDVRGKFHSARSFVESWYDNHWPADAPRYQRFISTALLRDMITLDFDGQDSWLMYTRRHTGFSVFSIYPLPDNADPGERRARTKAYEDTMDNHKPGDRQEMENLSQCTSQIPDSRTELWKWVRYFLAASETTFGPDAELLVFLRRILELINSERMFRYYLSNEWAGYFWKYHTAVRKYFSRNADTNSRHEGFQDLLFRMRQGQPVLMVEFPAEIRARHQGGDSPSPTYQHPSPRTTPQTSARSSTDPTAQKVAEEWARRIGPAVKKAQANTESAGQKWNLRLLYPDGCKEAFGNMLGIVKPNKAGKQVPCPRLFTYGNCRVKNCNASHGLTREPTTAEGKSFTDWIEKRASQFKGQGKGPF